MILVGVVCAGIHLGRGLVVGGAVGWKDGILRVDILAMSGSRGSGEGMPGVVSRGNSQGRG